MFDDVFILVRRVGGRENVAATATAAAVDIAVVVLAIVGVILADHGGGVERGVIDAGDGVVKVHGALGGQNDGATTADNCLIFSESFMICIAMRQNKTGGHFFAAFGESHSNDIAASRINLIRVNNCS